MRTNSLLVARCRPTLWGLVILLPSLAACGGATPAAPATEVPPPAIARTPVEPAQPTQLLAEGTSVVLHINVELLRQSPYFPTLQGWAQRAFQSARGEGKPDVKWHDINSLIEQTAALYLGASSADPSRRSAWNVRVVLRGDYESGKLEQWIKQATHAASAGASVKVDTHPGRTVIRAPGTSAVAEGDHTWIIAGPGQAEDVTARLERGSAGGLWPSEALAESATRVRFSEAMIGFAAHVDPPLMTVLKQIMGQNKSLAALRGVGARVDLEADLQATAILQLSDPAAAGALAQEFRGQLTSLRNQLIVGALGLGPILDNIVVRTEGSDVVGKLHLDEFTTRSLVSRVDGMIAMGLGDAP